MRPSEFFTLALADFANDMTAFFHRFSWIALLAVVLFAAPFLVGCGSDRADGADADQERNLRRVETLLLEPQSFDDIIEVTGTIEALDDAALSAQASGTLVSVEELGTPVGAGEIVAQINPREAQAAVEQARAQVESAEAQYELAEDNYERQEPLYQDSIISAAEFESVRSELAQARANLSQARASLSQAEEQLANTRIVTPFDGTVEDRLMKTGEQVSPGEQVVRVVNTERVRVRAGVPERYANDIELGTRVRVRVQSAALEDRTGHVIFVGGAIRPESRTFPIEVEIDNEDGRLKPEMVAKLFITREELEDAIVIPRTAVSRDEEGLDAYTVAHHDSFAVVDNHDVTLGPTSGNRAVVRSGLEAGQELIVVGQTDVSAGDTVEVAERHRSLASTMDALDEAGITDEETDSIPDPALQDDALPSDSLPDDDLPQ